MFLHLLSKAFTKEDDAAGFAPPTPSTRVPSGPFRLTATGARALAASKDAAVAAALQRAEVLAPAPANPARATLGVHVRVRSSAGEERVVRLVSAEERALLDEGCSVASPLGRALLGAQVGDVREVRAPRGVEELEIVALVGED